MRPEFNCSLIRSSLYVLLTAVALAPGLAAQTLYDTSPPAQTGAQVYGSYFSTDVDQVSLFNGNLNLHIPLYSLPGRELSAGRMAAYNGQKWEQRDCGGYPCAQFTGGWTVTGRFGSDPSFFAQYQACEQSFGAYLPAYAMNVYWKDGNGAKHRYMKKMYGSSDNSADPSCPNPQPPSFNGLSLPSMDSDGSFFNTGNYMSSDSYRSANIAFRDGGVRNFWRDASGNGNSVTGPNGNYLTKEWTPLQGPPSTLPVDTLDRTIPFWGSWPEPSSTNPPAPPYPTSDLTITDSNGVARTYTVHFTALTNLLDPYSGGTQPYLCCFVDSITLPNGKQWTFEYLTFPVYPPPGTYYPYISVRSHSRRARTSGTNMAAIAAMRRVQVFHPTRTSSMKSCCAPSVRAERVMKKSGRTRERMCPST